MHKYFNVLHETVFAFELRSLGIIRHDYFSVALEHTKVATS